MVETLLPYLNHTLAVGTVVGQVYVVSIFLLLVLNRRQERRSQLLSYVASQAILIGFLVAFASVVLSLFYSNVVGYTPCTLCWWQRIFMYPLVLLFGMALWKKDTKIVDYGIVFSVIGAVIGAYNHYIQLGGSPLVPCSAVVSCAQRFVFEFGYISIPLMSFTGFMIIAVSLYTYKKVTQ
jgi:disulfide bond formation protein DsbB